MEVKLVCWNVNGLRATLRTLGYEEFFRQLDADIICLQETKLSLDDLTQELALVPGYDSYWSCSRNKKGYSGVATFVKQR